MSTMRAREAVAWLAALALAVALAVVILTPHGRYDGLVRNPQFDSENANANVRVICTTWGNQYLDPNRQPRPGDLYVRECRGVNP